jgi:hypothetical protein
MWPGFFGEMKIAGVGADEAALGDDKVAAVAASGDAKLDVIGIEEVVGVEEADPVIGIRRGQQRAGAARDIAVIAMRLVELDVADLSVVDPALGKPSATRI